MLILVHWQLLVQVALLNIEAALYVTVLLSLAFLLKKKKKALFFFNRRK